MPLFTAFISQLISVLQDKGSAFISQLIEDPKHWSGSGNRARDLPHCRATFYGLVYICRS